MSNRIAHFEIHAVTPLTVAVIGTVLAPVLATVGTLATLLTSCTIIVERRI